MTSFLLVISLLLNGIAILSIIILYARQNRFLEVEKAQEQMAKDLEEMISSYLFELKEENEAFIKQFKQINANTPSKEIQTNNLQKGNKKKQTASKNINRKADEQEENEWAGKVGTAFKKQAVKAYKSAATKQEESPPVSFPNIMEDSHLTVETNATENNTEQILLTHEEMSSDLLSKVKALQKKGLSIDEIAKKMNRGITEIELLLKFS